MKKSLQKQRKQNVEYLYGINVVNEVVSAGRRKIFAAYVNEKVSDLIDSPNSDSNKNLSNLNKISGHKNRIRKRSKLIKLVCLLKKLNVSVEYKDKGFLSNLCKAREHQGIVIKTDIYPYISFNEVLQCMPDKFLMLDNIEDPQNLGAILRSAEVFGYRYILLPKKGTPEIYPSVVKASAGASEHLFIVKEKHANQYFKLLKDKGIFSIAIDKGGSDIKEISKFPKPFLLIIGGEDKGIGQFILNNSDISVAIKQSGRINSLNASVAAGIAMFHLTGTHPGPQLGIHTFARGLGMKSAEF